MLQFLIPRCEDGSPVGPDARSRDSSWKLSIERLSLDDQVERPSDTSVNESTDSLIGGGDGQYLETRQVDE